jgi:hypothetical protein
VGPSPKKFGQLAQSQNVPAMRTVLKKKKKKKKKSKICYHKYNKAKYQNKTGDVMDILE